MDGSQRPFDTDTYVHVVVYCFVFITLTYHVIRPLSVLFGILTLD